MADSTVLLYAGYPSHCLPDRTHFRPAAVSRRTSRSSAKHTLWPRLVAFNPPISGIVSTAQRRRAWQDSLAIITSRLDFWPTCPPLLLHSLVFRFGLLHIVFPLRTCILVLYPRMYLPPVVLNPQAGLAIGRKVGKQINQTRSPRKFCGAGFAVIMRKMYWRRPLLTGRSGECNRDEKGGKKLLGWVQLHKYYQTRPDVGRS